MRDPLRRDRVHQRLDDMGLTDDIGKRTGPIFTRRDLVIQRGDTPNDESRDVMMSLGQSFSIESGAR